LEYLQADNRKVHKNLFLPSNLILWTVEGQEQTYILYPEIYCQCQNFIMDSIYRAHKFKFCKHHLAQKIAEILNLYQNNQFSDSEYKAFIKNL
jgi:predicted nucleic acid-binding Zn finger protein